MPSKRGKGKRDYKVQDVPSTGAGQEHRTNRTKRTVSLSVPGILTDRSSIGDAQLFEILFLSMEHDAICDVDWELTRPHFLQALDILIRGLAQLP